MTDTQSSILAGVITFGSLGACLYFYGFAGFALWFLLICAICAGFSK